jgi:hypothetical protein
VLVILSAANGVTAIAVNSIFRAVPGEGEGARSTTVIDAPILTYPLGKPDLVSNSGAIYARR